MRMKMWRIRRCVNSKDRCMNAVLHSWKIMRRIVCLTHRQMKKYMMWDWSFFNIWRKRQDSMKKLIWSGWWNIWARICRARLRCWSGKRCRISALLQDHTGMPVCFVPFRDFEAKRTSISTRKKCRCPMTVWFCARRVWIICWKWWNRIIIWKSVLL